MEDVQYPIVEQNGKQFQNKPNGNLGSALMVFNKNVHNNIGFFTTEYNRYGEEDSDFGFRVRTSMKKEIGYILPMGQHTGIGENDIGEYRQFKDQCRLGNLSKFRENCRLYMSGRKPCYIPFENPGQYL